MKYLNFELKIEEIKYLLQQKLDRDYAEYKMKVYIQPNDFQNEEEYRNLMRKGEPVAILFADEKKFMKQMFIPPISELSKDFILCLEAKNELKNNKKEREYICDGGSFYDVLIDGANIIIIAKNENREFHRYLRNDLCFEYSGHYSTMHLFKFTGLCTKRWENFFVNKSYINEPDFEK